MIDTLKLYVTGEKWPAVQPALELILFSNVPRDILAPGFVAFYSACMKRYKPSFKWYQTNVMKSFKALGGPGFDQIKQMLTDKKSLKSNMLGVEHHSGPKWEQFGLPSFAFFSEEDASDPDDPIHQGFVRFCLPPAAAERADELFEFVCSASAEVAFYSGYCGYSYYWDVGNSDAEDELTKANRGWLSRFPGLAPGEPLSLSNFADKGLLGVSWITLLGQPLVEQLGGQKALERKLGKTIQVQQIGGRRGVALRAGAAPQLGDINRNEKLPNYHKVGRAVADVRVPDELIENLALTGLTGDDVVTWYGRFFHDAE